ncbi:hypothetical protein A2U01_0045324 [Trifolium medium]|uniref:Uncharacterized protein n=1 Tax=Trifolium medium TaxID=97028 RepID=A0A392QIC4_9FABA|nr:hypothetical protein [Trifolium medium]
MCYVVVHMACWALVVFENGNNLRNEEFSGKEARYRSTKLSNKVIAGSNKRRQFEVKVSKDKKLSQTHTTDNTNGRDGSTYNSVWETETKTVMTYQEDDSKLSESECAANMS